MAFEIDRIEKIVYTEEVFIFSTTGEFCAKEVCCETGNSISFQPALAVGRENFDPDHGWIGRRAMDGFFKIFSPDEGGDDDNILKSRSRGIMGGFIMVLFR